MRNVNLENLRVMVISSHDHDSLAKAQYLLRGQQIANNAIVLVPPRLKEAIAGEKNTRYEIWSSIEDLYALVDEHRPDYFYMVSASLMCLQEYVTVAELRRFFKHCGKSGCIPLTNDMLAGVLPHKIVENDAAPHTTEPDLDLPGRVQHLSALREPDQVVQELITAQKIPVWAFWESFDMPPIVERCYVSWQRHLDPEKYEIRLLTRETFRDYLPFDVLSEIPHFFELRLSQQADFIRLALLKWHGGIWLDASIYMVDELPFDGLLDEFYAPRLPRLDNKCVQVWLMVAPRQSDVINIWLTEFTVALQDRRDIKLRTFSLSLYDGIFARLMQSHDPKFKNYFMLSHVYENLYRTRRWFKKKTPNLTEQGITTSLQPDNVKFIFSNMRYATLTKLLKRFDPTEKWSLTQNITKRRDTFEISLTQRMHMPSLKMCKDGKVFLYKLNAADRLLMKLDFDFDSCP